MALLGLAVAVFPSHSAAFLNRFMLGSRHYPTRTSIDQILVNGKPVSISPGGDYFVKTAYGSPLRFEVCASGELPQAGPRRSGDGGQQPEEHARSAACRQQSPGDAQAEYRGQLPKLVDSLYFQVYLGDAWTEPVELRVIPLPVVELQLQPSPPSYAKGSDDSEEAAPGARQISVIEGSKVGFQLRCTNKRLSQADLIVEGKSYPLDEISDAPKEPGRHWSLKTAGTPLERIEKPTRYEVQVVDEDGMKLEQPIQGFIRIKADQRPRISADVVTRFVLPSGTPVIDYRANDDFGIGKLLIHIQSSRGESGDMQEKTLELVRLKEPILRDKLPWKGTYKLDLASLGLAKGDQVKVTLEAVDYRGAAAGQSATSEPLVLQVTDESGILAAISESDERSARQLDAIITRQLGIGDSK